MKEEMKMKKKLIIVLLIISLLTCFKQYIPKNYLSEETPPIVFVIKQG